MRDSQQYILPLLGNDRYILDNFITSSSNQVMYNSIKNWSIAWGSKPYEFTILLYGPPSSGKTYLSKIWQNLSNAFFIKKDSDILSAEHIMQYNAFIMEDIEFWHERKVLHCFNLISEYRKYLLMTTGSLANNFALQDLSSRINSVLRLEIKQPDDELMSKLIFKYFSDQSVKVSDCVIEYLLINLPRQFAQMIKLLGAITHYALVHKRAVTIPLIKHVLK
ncbi:MAG: hypothetical protein LN569_03100 [Rickettsia endosymbiont of Labidopullus appendiculatus]|nr:hypothetical protein [Rickettsia endosymbiont of Labidopullus appendiculatus]